MTINAIAASSSNFKPYGKMTKLPDLEEFVDKEQGWRCWITEEFGMPQSARIGMGFSETGAPYEISSMQRHHDTQKLFTCGSGPIILAVSSSEGTPKPEDIKAFILEPGDFAVIEKGIWYDACHGLIGPAHYYFLSLETDAETEGYTPLTDGSVTVQIPSNT